MIELRCDLALHAKFNPETLLLEIKCKDCSRALRQPIYHRWTLPDVIAQYERGQIIGACSPPSPSFVYWRVSPA